MCYLMADDAPGHSLSLADANELVKVKFLTTRATSSLQPIKTRR